MDHARTPSSEQLMAEMGWVRQLARALVKDAVLADDVAQDAWLVATQRQPAEDRPLRPWLARVVVNLVRTRRRGELRRDQRGAAFESTRSVPTPAELVERVELQRAVADEVLALAEPYRSTVLLHFVEGFSSAEIARRLEIPDGTVRRRLKAALDQLREALRKRSDPPKRGWLEALVPFARMPAPNPVLPAIGVLAMKKVISIVVLIILVLAIGAGLLWRRGTRTDEAAARGSASGSRPELAFAARDPQAEAKLPAWLPQANAPARRIAGRVVSHGAPIAGALVQLGYQVADEPDRFPLLPVPVLQPIAEVTAAADGTFDLGVQPPAVFTVSAAAAKYASASAAVTNADPRTKSDQIVLELGDCGSRMTGVVADASGGGIAKARISVAGLSGAESDASGQYSVCLSAGQSLGGTPTAHVRVEADHYGTIKHKVIVVGDIHHDFMLVPEAVLVGRVTTSDGQPVAGARVIAAVDSSELPHHVTSGWGTSDRDGAFRIAGLAPGTFHLTASAEGVGTASPVAAIAHPATTSHEIHLVVAAVGRVRGRVVMDGAPVGGVSVTALRDAHTPAGSCTSQADGSFVLDGVPYGSIGFATSPYEVKVQQKIQVSSATVDGVTLDVSKMATVRGHVTRHGQPVAGASVIPQEAPQGIRIGPPQPAKTDSEGAFVIEGLRGGPLRLIASDQIRSDHAGKAFSDWQSVALSPGEDKTVDFDLNNSGEVHGTVVDDAGAAVPGAYVRMEISDGTGDMCEAMTDAGGHFECAMLSGGEYRATVAPEPGAGQGFASAVGDRLDPIRVPKDGVVSGVTLAIKNERLAVSGSVVDDTGAPVPDVHVEAIGHGAASMDSPFAMSDANGRFEIGNLARGNYNLHAHAADGSETEVLDVAAGTKSASIKLARAGAIDGTLSGFSTTPYVSVNAVTSDLRIGGLAIVDGTTFSRIGLPPGTYAVEAKAGAEVDGQSVELHPGETAHVTLTGRGVGTVQGTVSELVGHAPVVGMRCDGNLSMGGQMSAAPPDVSQQAFTDAAGHFAVNAPIGRVRIFCFSLNGGLLSAAGTDVDVATSAVATVNVFSVRSTFGNLPGDPGFGFTPDMLPLTVNIVAAVGPAAAAGLLVGDHVLTIDGASLDGVLPDGATFLLMNHHAGTVATLGVERGGNVRTIKISIGAGQP